jgi:hypothetical protein
MVIQRRESLMDIPTSGLSTEDMLCLSLLVEYGGAAELKDRLEAFRRDGTLKLTKSDPEEIQQESADAVAWLDRGLQKRREPVRHGNAGAPLRYSDGQKLASLKTLRILALEKIDQEILNIMSDLPDLRVRGAKVVAVRL